jgi:hypothetical protein
LRVFQGRSFETSTESAIAEVTAGWPRDLSPEVLFVFASTRQDPQGIASALATRYPAAQVVGCTTAGEQLSGEHSNGAVVVSALAATGIRWAATAIDELATFDGVRAEAAVATLFEGVKLDRSTMDPADCFCVLLVDGMCRREETISALVAEALEGVALIGGSAGDDLAFARTQVLFGGAARSDRAVLLMGYAPGRFTVLKHQHYITTPRRLVVTKCDGAERRIHELNGRPALAAYADALGLRPEQVDGDVTFMNPVTFSCHGQIYVRSIQSVQPDGSIVFYCGVEEGMVLEIGSHREMTDALALDLRRSFPKGPPAFLVTFNCILRALEAKKLAKEQTVGALLKKGADASIGFATYGEQLDGMHINQTLVALAISRDA